MAELILFGSAYLATTVGIAIFKRYGSVRMLDVPNERSSHARPTPRGGGIVIAVVSLAAYGGAAHLGGGSIKWPYIMAAVIIAGISWLDDVHSLSPLIRLLSHTLAAIIVIWGCGYIESLYIPFLGSSVELGRAGILLTFLWIVWFVNAYNFMDGIDGIAGTQAVVAGSAWSILGYISGEPILYFFAAAISFSGLGFLAHNWEPASVFMGDVGSAFLGFTFAVMPLLIDRQHGAISPRLSTAAIALVWLFVFDAVLTFTRRLLKRELVWTAHRQHLYQRLVIKGYGHGVVSLLYGASGSLVAGAFIYEFGFSGIGSLLFICSLAVSAGLIMLLAFRKKV